MTKQELVETKVVLEQEMAEIEAGGKFPIILGLSYNRLLRSKEYALGEYRSQINALDQKIKDAERQEEKEAREKQAAEAANEKQRVLLRTIIAQLPVEWKTEIGEDKYDGPFIKTGEGVGVSLSLKNIYSKTSRWSRGTATGMKLVISTNLESRGFPRKKDGTFNVEKAVAFAKEQFAIHAAKEARSTTEGAQLMRFKELVKPYWAYGVSSTEKRFSVSNTFEIFVKRTYGAEDQYIVQRTTTETVTAEQLKQILENEVPKVKKEETIES